jgi:hypothetical protein
VVKMRSMAIVLAASAALLVNSTQATAATTATPTAAATQPAAPDAWLMLSVLSPTRSVALGGAAAAAQPANVPPPPPAEAGAGFNGEVIPFVLWFGLIAIALTISGSSGGVAQQPNSAP